MTDYGDIYDDEFALWVRDFGPAVAHARAVLAVDEAKRQAEAEQ